MNTNKAHSNVFNCACLSGNLAHHSSFHFSLRGSPLPENTDVPRKPIPCGGMTLLHTDIFPSVTWHNSVCDLKIQNINEMNQGQSCCKQKSQTFPASEEYLSSRNTTHFSILFSLTRIISLQLLTYEEIGAKMPCSNTHVWDYETTQCLTIHNLSGKFLPSPTSPIPVNCFSFFHRIIFSHNFVVL